MLARRGWGHALWPEGFWPRWCRSFRTRASNALVAELEGLFEWLTRVSEAHGKLIREMLSPIVKGQLLDIDRFSHAEASAGTVGCLPEGDALDEYTYLVAGCVGAFWTDMCAMETRGFSRSFGPGEMRERGIRLGKGLQLINVLRDFPRDLAGGRCYLPAAEIEAAGIDPADPGLRRLGKETLAPVEAVDATLLGAS